MALRRVNLESGNRIESEQFDFTNKGDSVKGTLLEKVSLTSKKNGKTFMKYVVRDKSGANLSFLGGFQIDKGLSDVSTGTYIEITYAGEKKLDGGRRLKQYTIDIDDSNVAESPKTAAEVVKAARIA